MPAYVISEIEPIDAEALAAYRSLAAPTVAAYGGAYLARGGTVETVENDLGGAQLQVVIITFPSLERAREWYRSPEYAKALAVRPKASRRRLTFVEGLAPAT